MKNVLSIIAFLLSAISIFAKSDSIRGQLFQLTGKMINEISMPPDCGLVAWGTVVEFQIIEFSDTSYKQDSIGVIFTCPEFYGDDFFEIGMTYH